MNLKLFCSVLLLFAILATNCILAVPILCSDGTFDNSCSATLPLYCDAGNLVNNCTFCGCNSGELCSPSRIESKLISAVEDASVTSTNGMGGFTNTSFLKFNLTFLPASATIKEATLVMIGALTPLANMNVYVGNCTNISWYETNMNASGLISAPTSNCRSNGNWTSVVASGGANKICNFNVTDYVNGTWLTGTNEKNLTLFLNASLYIGIGTRVLQTNILPVGLTAGPPATNAVYFNSSEPLDGLSRPYINVTYTEYQTCYVPVQPCTLTSISFSPNCAANSPDCEQGETISLSGTYTGDCSSGNFLQIDARNSSSSCVIENIGADMTGINSNVTHSGGSISGTWTIPTIPSACQGKIINAIYGALYNWPGVQLDGENAAGTFKFYTPALPTCVLTSATIIPDCAAGSSLNCEEGENIILNGTYTGDCSSADLLQIDVTSSDFSCVLQYIGQNMSGIYSAVTPNSGIVSGTWTIPAIPAVCQGKTISTNYPPFNLGALWQGTPGTGIQISRTNATGEFNLYSPPIVGLYSSIGVRGRIIYSNSRNGCENCSISINFLDVTNTSVANNLGEFQMNLKPSSRFNPMSYVINGTIQNPSGRRFIFKRTITIE